MSIAPDKFLDDWSAQEFYHLVRFLSWEGKAQKDYSEIIAAKLKANQK